MSSDNYVDLTLSAQQATDPLLEVAPEERDLLEPPELNVADQIQIRIGSRPIARDLIALYAKRNETLPPELETVRRGYRIWLLTVAVSLMKEPGKRDVRRLSIELDFPESPKVHVIDVLPRTSYITFAKGAIRGTCNASLDLGGRMAIPAGTLSLPAAAASGEAKVEVGVGVSLLANVGFEVVTPEVEAIGVAGSFAHWVFTRHGGRPLVGDHLVCATLLVPRNRKELQFRARTTATVTTYGFLESPWQSGWSDLVCELR